MRQNFKHDYQKIKKDFNNKKKKKKNEKFIEDKEKWLQRNIEYKKAFENISNEVQLLSETVAAKEKVATNLQALFRGNNAREDMKKLRNATGVLQKMYRGHMARNQIEKMREKQKEDLKKQNESTTKSQSTISQALFRVKNAREDMKKPKNATGARNQKEKMREKQKEDDLKKQNQSTTKTQSLHRRHDAPSKVNKIRKERKLEKIVTDLQKI